MSSWRVVFAKEVRENLRDRRSVSSSLLFGPLLGPLIFSLMIAGITRMEMDRAEDALEVSVVGAQYAPNLIRFLGQHGLRAKPAVDDPQAAVRREEEELVIIVTPQYGERLQRGEPAPVTLVLDRSRRNSGATVSRVRALLRAYSRQIGRLRLLARGVDPKVADAIRIEEEDLSTARSRGAQLLGMFPYFLFMAIFMGGMYLAIDTTAGEKERNSLEALLINPLPRWQIMAGKLSATLLFSLISLLLTLIAFALSVKLIPSQEMGLQLDLNAITLMLIFITVAPTAVIAAALQTIIAAFSHSFREAQTYLSLLLLLPMIPTLALMIAPVKGATWMMWVPVLGQNLLVDRLIRGELLVVPDLAQAIIASLLLGALLMVVAARLYDHERMVL